MLPPYNGNTIFVIQARAKSLRLYLRSELKPDYGRIFELVAHHINSTVAEVEEFVIDDQKVIF